MNLKKEFPLKTGQLYLSSGSNPLCRSMWLDHTCAGRKKQLSCKSSADKIFKLQKEPSDMSAFKSLFSHYNCGRHRHFIQLAGLKLLDLKAVLFVLLHNRNRLPLLFFENSVGDLDALFWSLFPLHLKGMYFFRIKEMIIVK